MVGPAHSGKPSRLRESAQHILSRSPQRPRIALLLGSGHASIAGQLKEKVAFQGDDLPPGLGLASPLLIGVLEGVPVAVADAPILPLETGVEVTLLVRLLRALGCEVMFVTAGAASLSQQIDPGSIALIEDHINLTGLQPLRSKSDEQWGPSFPDMSDAYSQRWLEVARDVAMRCGIPCLPGVLAAVPGPSMPTRAEYRFLRQIGADLVGMSLVPEVIAAVHAGFQVLALVGVTQQVLPQRSPANSSIEAMIDAAELAAPRMASILVGVVAAAQKLLD
ncbi:MAG: purine-nucleoside phosphorylase [Planctomycetota bacterium]